MMIEQLIQYISACFMTTLVADIEANSLNPNRIWMIGILDLDTDDYTAYIGDDEIPNGLMRLMEADRVVGHSFKSYDAKVIRNLTDGLVDIPNDKIDDTVEISRALFPEMPNHRLATWGEIFEYPKIDYDKGFEKFHPDMVPYCERDVRLNAVLYKFFLTQIEALESK